MGKGHKKLIRTLHKAENVKRSPCGKVMAGYLVRPVGCSVEGACFVNAVLSNLLAMDVLRNYFVQSVDESFGPLNAYLRKLFLDTSQQVGIRISNDAINLTPLFLNMCTRYPGTYATGKGGNPWLFMKNLIDGLTSEELSSRLSRGVVSDDAAYVDSIFRIKFATSTSDFSSSKDITQMSLVLSVPCQDAESKNICSVSIERCLDFYMANLYNLLKKLSDKRDTTEIKLIKKAPTVLAINLGYAMYGFDRCSYVKFNGRLDFGETLDLKPYMDPGSIDIDDTYKYRLIGMVEATIVENTNHAISFVRGTNSKGGYVWYLVDGTMIRKFSVEEVLGRKPISLFYEKY